MRLISPAFRDGGEIPEKYAKDGEDRSPPLTWSDVPAEAVSLALIVDDPDAPRGTWTHWVVTDLPARTTGLQEGATAGHVGLNDWKHAAWNGPAPPQGRHRYEFKLFALDRELGLSRPTRHEVERAMAGHVLAEAKLTGTYQAERAA
ncbi:MAG TPA: YbhB/YbcL family Raf kinase inhibitor-like protein [Kofleriaceae bacterium]